MLKNISNSIDFCEKIKIMRELYCDEKYIRGQISDFELFDEWERVNCLAAGHRELSAYRNQLENLELSALNFGEYSRKGSCNRWALANNRYYENELVACCAGEAFYEEKRPLAERIYKIDIDKTVSKYVIECKEYSELVDKIIAEVFGVTNSDISIEINTDDCEYNRPDPYSARCIFDAIARGEKYNNSQRFLLSLQILAELLYHNKKRHIRSVHFFNNGNIDAASAATRYIFARNLLKGEIIIDVSAYTDMQDLSELSGDIYPSLKLVPNILAADVADLKRIFHEYPVGACRADNSLDRGVLREVLSCICDSKEHSEYLEKILYQ